jgi:hypothetical protein
MDAKDNALAVIRGKAKANDEVLDTIAECRRKLALDFDTPAYQIIQHHAAKLGLTKQQFDILCEKCSGL